MQKEKRQVARAEGSNPISDLYTLLSSPGFAIFVIIALAVTSILGIALVDQVPFRGEMARLRYPGRESDPFIWFLIHVVPDHPFRCPLYRVILALLSLSLLTCVIKRWRSRWRQALTNPLPAPEVFDGTGTVAWTSTAQASTEEVVAFFRRRLFAVRTVLDGNTVTVAASRFGIARLGAVLTHLGLLLLVVGGLWMAFSGSSFTVWMNQGDVFEIPETPGQLELKEFRIETTPRGQVSDYISSVCLCEGDTVIREMEIEVNKPLRYRGRSFYQTTYRRDPLHIRSLHMVYDQPVEGMPGLQRSTPGRPSDHPGDQDATSAPAPASGQTQPPGHPRADAMDTGPHGQASMRFRNPVTHTLRPGERWAIPSTPYAAEIDTFFCDFRIVDGEPHLASQEPRNPAVRLRYFEEGVPAGEKWHFILHPEMAIGDGPSLPLRFATYEPVMQTGLDMATHPGAEWVWAGIVVMTLGTLLSFMLRHERVWLRIRPADRGSGLAAIHRGASTQDPRLVKEVWQASTTSLVARLFQQWRSGEGVPDRWPGSTPGDGRKT
ncbi:cytochrome c biogenesis protein ResB [Candidatus Eisenbacteria bacterium]|uniref:Cytochrome c biogenesis protein ResB n=1 Tax=Eiseniibacteriota bacterium TaxID=2212470 RepID=A0ABV6YIT5_UNCEI